MKRAHRILLVRIGILLFAVIMAVFFITPLLWFVFSPLNPQVSFAVTIPQRLSFENFELVFKHPRAIQSLLQNSTIIGGGVMIGIALVAALTAYGLSRSTLPGRHVFSYVLILFSSVVTGTASMVPIFLLIRSIGLLDTHLGVILVMIGGLLPTATFTMRDFVEGVPRSYEEAAMVCGASPPRVFWDIAYPLFRPGVMVVAIWAFVNAWGAFLIPFILLRSQEKIPASVRLYSFYDVETGTPQVALIAAYAVLYVVPVLLLYLLVNWRYGFRFFGGIKR